MNLEPKPGRRRRNDPNGVRQRILDAAADLFQVHGFGSTSTQDLIAAARVTAGAFHHHFPTKKALALCVIRERVSNAVEETWITPVERAGSVRQGVLAVFGEIERGLLAAGKVDGCPLNNLALELSAADPDIRREIQSVFSRWRDRIADCIRRDQKAGRLKQAAPDQLATLIVSAYSGAMAIAKAEQRPHALAQCRLELSDRLSL